MSVHIGAKKGEIAETILLPGDPLRAKWIAENYLESPKCYNDVRGMLGYTGTYKGKRVSVQGTGMGIPSALIYCNELIKEYGVKKLIRVGSAGAYQASLALRDVVIAMSASTNSNAFAEDFHGVHYAATASYELFKKATQVAEEKGITYKAGQVLSSDTFYENSKDAYKKWAKYGVLCVEMETAALYTLAAKYNVEALAILTISDSLVTGKEISAQDREDSLSDMMEIALGSIK
ncbi:MAG TPA: purine-nucleoside phosphorylase [Flavobacteriaceae bacterium]|nr:purine-nucleoside phosphorylase [Flavobacteriaceae bacterium]